MIARALIGLFGDDRPLIPFITRNIEVCQWRNYPPNFV